MSSIQVSADDIARVPATIADALRSDILAVRIRPGEALTEAAVAARFDVSRTSARLALDRLVGAGLLVREANRGVRVPQLTRADVEDLYENRALLERAAAAALARAGSVPADAIRFNRALANSPDDAPFAPADIAFHRALVHGQPSPRLARMHEGLLGEIELCIGQVQAHRLWVPADIARQHAGILTAIVEGDAERAGRLAADHVAASRSRLLDHLDRAG